MKRLWFEIDRINKWKITAGMVALLLLSILATSLGSLNYQGYLIEKNNIIRSEKFRADNYNTYSQYGSNGIIILSDIPALSILFKNANPHVSHINTSQMIDITDSKRRNHFRDNSMDGLTFGYLLYIYSLFFFVYGLTAMDGVNRHIFYRNLAGKTKSIMIRLVLFLSFVVGVLLICVGLIHAFGITFNQTDWEGFWIYLTNTLFFLAFFYSLGVLLSASKVKGKITVMLIIWVILGVIMPKTINKVIELESGKNKSLEILKIEKLSNLIGYEKRFSIYYNEMIKKKNIDISQFLKNSVLEYENTISILNASKEKQFISFEKNLAERKKKLAMFFPTLYYNYISNELVDGDKRYIDFENFLLEKQDKFTQYISRKRHFEKAKEVYPFCPPEENVFKAGVVLPNNLFHGILFQTVLIVTLLLIAFSRMKPEKENPNIEIDKEYKPGCYFEFFNDLKEFERACQGAKGDKDITFIRNLPDEEFSGRITLKHYINYLCDMRRVNPADVERNLKLFGLENKTVEINERIMRRIIASVFMAENTKIFVICDFCKGEEKDFDTAFRQLMKEKADADKLVIYYTTVFPDVISKEKFLYPIGELEKVEINKVSFR